MKLSEMGFMGIEVPEEYRGVGAGLAQTLSKRTHQVTVVDTNPDAFERLGPSFKGKTILGIGFDRDTLIQAGIERADGLAAVTSSR
jgi:trk system potassium uptake protein TrkA